MGDPNKPRSETGSFERAIRITGGTMRSREIQESINRAHRALDSLNCNDAVRGTILSILSSINLRGEMTYDAAVDELLRIGDVEEFKRLHGHDANAETDAVAVFKPRESTGSRPRPDFAAAARNVDATAAGFSRRIGESLEATPQGLRRSTSSHRFSAVTDVDLDKANGERVATGLEPVKFDPKRSMRRERLDGTEAQKFSEAAAKIRADIAAEDAKAEKKEENAASVFAGAIKALKDLTGIGKKEE